MKSVKNDDPKFEKAVKLASRSYNDFEVLGYPSSHPPKKSRGISAACKVKASEVIVLYNTVLWMFRIFENAFSLRYF